MNSNNCARNGACFVVKNQDLLIGRDLIETIYKFVRVLPFFAWHIMLVTPVLVRIEDQNPSLGWFDLKMMTLPLPSALTGVRNTVKLFAFQSSDANARDQVQNIMHVELRFIEYIRSFFE